MRPERRDRLLRSLPAIRPAIAKRAAQAEKGEEVKCPVCLGEVEVRTWIGAHHSRPYTTRWWQARCEKCDLETRENEESEAEAVRAWGERELVTTWYKTDPNNCEPGELMFGPGVHVHCQVKIVDGRIEKVDPFKTMPRVRNDL